MGMEDDQAALHIARLLECAPWHRLPAVALLRLTGILCYDIAQAGAAGLGNRLARGAAGAREQVTACWGACRCLPPCSPVALAPAASQYTALRDFAATTNPPRTSRSPAPQGTNLRADIDGRVENISRIIAERYRDYTGRAVI